MEKEGNGGTTKKRSRATNLLRAATLAFRWNYSCRKPAANDDVIVANASTAETVIKAIVSSMRPLHPQLDFRHSPPPPPPPPPALLLDSYYDVGQPPPMPHNSDCTSRYASAEDLPSIGKSGKEDDDEMEGDVGETNAIDKKADEFIAMFYEQMLMHRADSIRMTEEGEC